MDALVALRDPVLLAAVSAACGAVLLIGALDKLFDVDRFRQAVADYQLLPVAVVPPFSIAFALLEAIAGLGICGAPVWPQSYAATLAATLLTVASAGVAVNLLRGRRGIECGCGGAGQPISWGLVLRNAALIGLIALSAQVPSARAIEAIDFLSGGAAFLFLLAAYFATSQLLGNEQYLKGGAT